MISTATVVCIGVIAAGHQAAHLVSRASLRRREARALRTVLLDDIAEGRRTPADTGVHEVLTWADHVAATGHDTPVPLPSPSPPRDHARFPTGMSGETCMITGKVGV